MSLHAAICVLKPCFKNTCNHFTVSLTKSAILEIVIYIVMCEILFFLFLMPMLIIYTVKIYNVGIVTSSCDVK